MFKDYYQILAIQSTATTAEIKQAYRVMSVKWHPDKHPNCDTTEVMQDINEAYRILSNQEAKARYDKEYKEFAQHKYQHSNINNNSNTYDYDVRDENLKADIASANKYAKDIVAEFMAELKQTSKIAAKGAWDNMIGYFIGAIIFFIICALIRAIH